MTKVIADGWIQYFNAAWHNFKPLVGKYLDITDMSELRSDSSWEELGLDSLDYVELIMYVEEKYEVDLPDDKVDDIKTIGGLHILLIRALESQREVDITHRDTEHARGSAISKARNLPYQGNPGRCSHCGRG
jgi:acyl carrier protein